MNKKIFIFILFIQLSGLVQSQPLDKICEREPCEEKNDSTSGNVTNVISHANNVISRFSSLFKAVRSIGNSIYYIADVAVDIAEESTVDLFSAIKKDLSEMQTNRMSEETHDLITHKEIAKPDKEEEDGDKKKITTDKTSKSGGKVGDKKNMKTDEPSKIGGGVKDDEDTPADQPYNELENKQTNEQDKTLGENNDKLDIRTGQPTVEEDKDKAHIKEDQQNKTERLSMDDGLKVERSGNDSVIIKWSTVSGAGWKLKIDRLSKTQEIKELALGTTFYNIKNVDEGDVIHIALFDGKLWHDASPYEHRESESSISSKSAFFDGSWHKSFKYEHRESESSTLSRSAATESSKDNSFKVERSTDNSFIVEWTRRSEADWKILIDSVRPYRQRKTIRIPLGTTFYKIKYVNEGDIIDVTFFDGSWHEGFRYQHQDSESSISSRSAATESAKDNSFKVERSTDNSFIVEWTRRSEADWKILIDGVRPYRQRKEISIPYGSTFYRMENVNEGDIIDVTFFDGSWHEGFRYHHQDSEGSISSRLGAAGTAKDNSFKVERSTDNSLIVKWTRGSAANWKLLIDGVRPWKQREEISIPFGTTFYKIENVNEDDIVDVTFFDGSWHETFRHEP
ncbi:hypothetical protein HCN44_005567 [Aphidius gifuensis]|uniref:Venom protein n=1 Tax=Aphidius gifuensis TaxID=684658 RepID=A0A834Y0X9_APHGI|nr:hypothetical protein HCN44_005567 [Aphidius gifuensis]